MTGPGQMPGRRLHAQDRLATGAPVYNGASNAATMGTVDPSGYVERERRSGLAAAMLGSGAGRRPGAKGLPQMLATTPEQVGETAGRLSRRDVVRRLAARMNGQEG